MEKIDHMTADQFSAAMGGLVEIAQLGGNERELLFSMASLMQQELSGDGRPERKYPYASSLEMIMRAVMFALKVGDIDGAPLDQLEQGYIANKLLDNGVPALLKASGYSGEMVVRTW